jgi:hypothetical protein
MFGSFAAKGGHLVSGGAAVPSSVAELSLVVGDEG